jgi:hypothetical protein
MRTLSAAALLSVGLAFVLLASTAQADCPHNGKTDHPHCDGGTPPPPDNQNVYIKMNAGDGDVTLATSGPLEVFAVCTDSGNVMELEIFVTGSEDGWFEETAGLTPRTIGEEVSVGIAQTQPSQGEYTRIELSAVSPSGHYINGDLGRGLNIGDSDCLVAGLFIFVHAP